MLTLRSMLYFCIKIRLWIRRKNDFQLTCMMNRRWSASFPPVSHSLYVLLRSGLSLCLVALLMLHASGHVSIRLLNQLELLAYDARLRLTLPGGVDPRIVIVAIDEASLLQEGQWPWPRQRLAQLVDTLFTHYKVRLLGFDLSLIHISEPTRPY